MKRRLWLGVAAGAALATAIVMLLSEPRSASAATCTWTGATDSDWGTTTNWTGCGGVTPGTADAVSINSGGNQPILIS